MVHGATEEDTIGKLRNLHPEQWLGYSGIVRQPVKWEKRTNNGRDINKFENVRNGHSISFGVDEQGSSIVAIDKNETL
ncbi:hypothetical protein F3Y22_tig00110729pilonHSYRG00142 [Hibiscus syriacus]|uniref:Uncharacterized protein n=1 Tax=Hibiscus syriacus TaxID=106335 RepID=A0A6A2ZVU5_HIBSY|nr:hypothetical protein F3Y22_tig00110729pilonHSYRG00142 [Hibiscus syriacus]